jgi:molybdenum cofactor synthesis domain-containing protein
MKMIPVEQAVGSVLCHDMTKIVPGEFKGVAFKKGHVITEEDVPKLLAMGKEHIYVWEKEAGMLHEDEAAERLGALCKGQHITGSDIREGKMNMVASCDGLLKINLHKLEEINKIDEIMIAARHQNFMVKAGDKLAGTRVIPLVVKEEKVEWAESIGGSDPLMWIMPQKEHRLGIVTTGSEIYHGRIQDAFGPVIRNKAAEYGVEVIEQIIVDDDQAGIVAAIKTLEDKGATMIVCTGGMSVDPDDRTPSAIKESGAEIISYGAPVLPGAMFLLSYKEDMPIMGLPGCVMYAKRTIFDLVFPRVLCGEKLSQEDLAMYGHGGLCLECETCTFPQCGFGRGC